MPERDSMARMNLIAVARHGIGIAGVPPLGIAIARGLAIELIGAADAEALAVQAAGADGEAAWLTRIRGRLRRAPMPPGIAFALRVENGTRVVGSLLVAERERDLGDRPGVVVRIGREAVELDRRDGSAPLPVTPRYVGLDQAAAMVRALAT